MTDDAKTKTHHGGVDVRKIKECICDSTEKFDDSTLSICLSYFIQNMANILVVDSGERLKREVPDMIIGGDRYEGKAKTNPGLLDVISILNREDMIRSMGQHLQLHNFLIWFLEQDEPDETDDNDDEYEPCFWYDIDFLADKWNEFAQMKEDADE